MQKPTRSQVDNAPLRSGEPIVKLLSLLPLMTRDVAQHLLRLLTRWAKLSLRTRQTLYGAGAYLPLSLSHY